MSYKKKDKNLYNGMNIKKIMFYDPKDDYFFFSNFYKGKIPLIIEEEKWLNTEQYYQAMKYRGEKASERMIEYSNIIKSADSPMKVKLLGAQKKDMRFGKRWKINKKTDERLVNDVVDEYKDLKIREYWKIASIVVMITAIHHKFNQYTNLKKEIMKIPDNTYIIEHTNRDNIWGDGGDGGDGTKGKNQLGKILTAVVYIIKYGNCSKMSKELREIIKIRI